MVFGVSVSTRKTGKVLVVKLEFEDSDIHLTHNHVIVESQSNGLNLSLGPKPDRSSVPGFPFVLRGCLLDVTI